MDYPVVIDGFEDHEIAVRSTPWGAASTLLLDGEVAPPGQRRNQFILTRKDGTEALVKFRNGLFDSVPQLVVDGKVTNVVPPLSWPITVWCLAPLLLCFTPGFDGILLGFGGSWVNTRIFRTERSDIQKYLLTALVFLAAAGIYLLVSGRLAETTKWMGDLINR
jgi:hypothetical protein